MTETLRVGIIEPNSDVRFGKNLLINSDNRLRVVFEEGDSSKALERIGDYLIDVVLVSTNQIGFTSGEYIRALSNRLIETDSRAKILAYAPYDSESLREEVIAAGAEDAKSLALPATELLNLIAGSL